MNSLPNYENKKFDKKIIEGIKQSNILASTEKFDTNRSLHQSPNPKISGNFGQVLSIQMNEMNKGELKNKN